MNYLYNIFQEIEGISTDVVVKQIIDKIEVPR